jgi:hypothetical protein
MNHSNVQSEGLKSRKIALYQLPMKIAILDYAVTVMGCENQNMHDYF